MAPARPEQSAKTALDALCRYTARARRGPHRQLLFILTSRQSAAVTSGKPYLARLAASYTLPVTVRPAYVVQQPAFGKRVRIVLPAKQKLTHFSKLRAPRREHGPGGGDEQRRRKAAGAVGFEAMRRRDGAGHCHL